MFTVLFLSSCGGGGGGDPAGNDTGDGSAPYTISVITSGLGSSGLTVGVSSGAGIETLTISSNGTRSFTLALPEGSLYTVGIGTQPSGQSCSLGGDFYDTNMTSDASVTVTCVSTRSIGGSITGLTGDVRLSLNGTNRTTFSANGSFVFEEQLADGDYYAVAVDTHPDGQTCLLTNSGGQLSASNISDIAVTCSASVAGYKVGGYVSGFSGAVTLNLNGIEEISTTTNGSFEFSSSLSSDSAYSVTVASTPVGYECSVQNGTGTIASSDFPFVDIDCQTSSTIIKPMVDPDGLYSGDTITVTLNAVTDMTLDDWDFNPVAFSSGLNPGDSYEVTIKTLPAGKSCLLYNSVGVIKASVTPVITLSCVNDTASSYSIGGSISGLTGSGLVLSLDGRDSLAVAASSSSFTFSDLQLEGTSHTMTVLTQPTGQICSITGSNPYVNGSNVTDVNIICSTGPHSIGGSAIGVTTSGLSLKLNDTETLSLPANGSFAFTTLLSDGMSYEVSIASQPADQVCSINNADGWNISTSVNDVLIECQIIDYSVATNIKGYNSSTPLLLQLNGDEIIEATSNTISGWYPYPFSPLEFDTHLKTGESYYVSIAGQPAGQVCTLTNNSGVTGTNDISDIGALCVTEETSAGPYSVSVTTSGLVGSGLVLQLNTADDLAVATDGYDSFTGLLADTTAYSVSVLTQPSAPLQLCTVVNGSGTISAGNITEVSVQCGNAATGLYPDNGGKWLDYVKNDGVNNYSANDLACDTTVDTGGYDVCLNGGEYMSLSIPDLDSCTNVTAVDSLNAFNWVCDNSSGVRIISTGLKTGVGLTDLIDFTEASFRPNFITVYDTSVYVDETQPAIWWDNPVKVNHTGLSVYSGEIHLVNAAVSSGISMNNNSAVLLQPDSLFAGTVSASSKSYLWFEGDITGSTGSGVSIGGTSFSVIQNAQLLNNANYGVYISGNNNKLTDITANTNGGSGIDISGTYLQINNLTANNNAGYYGINISTSNSNITNLLASDNINGTGAKLNTTGNVNISNVVANANGTALLRDGHGIMLDGDWSSQPGPHNFTNLTANNNGDHGIYAVGFSDSSFTDISVNNNASNGISLRSSITSPLSNISANGNGGRGIYLYRWKNTQMDNINAANNALDGINIYQSPGVIVRNVNANNNTGHGYVIDSTDQNITSNVTATNNNGSGIAYLGSSTSNDNNILIGATSANNAANGFELTRMGHLNLSSLLALNNGGSGIYTHTFIDYVTISNVLSANNSAYGFNIDSSYDYYTGLLEMGNNALGDCILGSFGIERGFARGGASGNPDNTCVLNGASDGTLVIAVDGSTSVVGKVIADDLSTGDDDATPGTSLFDNITGWSSFDHAYRSWGIDGSLAFADSSNQGGCNVTGDSCRIWDWSSSTSDAGNASSAAVNNVVALPTATDVLSMVWIGGSATDQAYCDTNYPGSIWGGGTTCESTYLRHAQEIFADSIGNDNGLCENSETCLYMPNIGSYQGHGALIAAGTVGAGADTIILQQYETIGR